MDLDRSEILPLIFHFIKTHNLELQTKIQNNHAELLSNTTKINKLEQLKVRKIYLF